MRQHPFRCSKLSKWKRNEKGYYTDVLDRGKDDGKCNGAILRAIRLLTHDRSGAVSLSPLLLLLSLPLPPPFLNARSLLAVLRS